MDNSLHGVQPERLTSEELAYYAWLFNTDSGLPRHWCDVLIARLEAYVNRYGPLPERDATTQQSLL